MSKSELQACNFCLIRGQLSSLPRERSLPSGDILVQLEVTVRPDEAPASSVPIAIIDPDPAVALMQIGDAVTVRGRVQRRFFSAGGATASRCEVVADEVIIEPNARRRRRVVQAGQRLLEEHV